MFDFQEWTSWTHLTSTTTKLKSSVPVSLKVIPRTSHNLESTGDHFCSGMPRVTSLKLDYNKINKIHDEAFYGLEGWQKHI